jgi:hypothetical protein
MGLCRYSPKFTAYLARLLINFDFASTNWWERKTIMPPTSVQQITRLLATKGFDDTFTELDQDSDGALSRDELLLALTDADVQLRREQELFSQFQASVSFGLVRYQGREGVGRLFKLLKSEFGLDRAGKRQLALLFSLMDNLQPVEAIKQLIGEAEDGKITGFNITYPGFGYNAETPPKVTISPSPGYNVTAVASVRLEPTGRLLKIVLDKPITGRCPRPDDPCACCVEDANVRPSCRLHEHPPDPHQRARRRHARRLHRQDER